MPSPKSMTTSVAITPLPMPTVNATGVLTVTVPAGGVSVTVELGWIVTPTVPESVPDVPPPALAVTVAAAVVVSVVVAFPRLSVTALGTLSVPAEVENVTGTPPSGLPS